MSEFDPLHDAHTPLMHHRLVAVHMPAAAVMPAVSLPAGARMAISGPVFAGPGCLAVRHSRLRNPLREVLADALSKRS